MRSAWATLTHLFAWLSPRSVVDVGCGVGTWLLVAQQLGAKRIVGLDGDYVDRSHLRISAQNFVSIDLERQELTNTLSSDHVIPFDLVICVEVAEHLPIARASSFIKELTQLGDIVLFSAAIPFQGGCHHINEQWPEYWALLFAGYGYECLDPLRRLLWDRADVEWWYAQNALLFVRKGSLARDKIPGATEASRAPLALVHPENLLFRVLHTFRPQRRLAFDEEIRDFRALSGAWRSNAVTLPRLSPLGSVIPEVADVIPPLRTEVTTPDRGLAARDATIACLMEELRKLREDITARDAAVARATEQVKRLQEDIVDRETALSGASSISTLLSCPHSGTHKRRDDEPSR